MALVNCNSAKFHSAEIKARAWLLQAHLRADAKGFCHNRWMYLPDAIAWAKPYPETSGYLIENLLEDRLSKDWGFKAACATMDWLLEIQSEEGYFHSGLEFKLPSAFNTAQILFGFRSFLNFQNDVRVEVAMDRATNWLLAQIDENGCWTQGLYSTGHFPAYYSRAIWPLLEISKTKPGYSNLLKSLDLLWACRKEHLYFAPCNFFPYSPVLSHTLAYAMEGFLESARNLNRKDIMETCLDMLEQTASEYLKRSRLWAEISDSGSRIYSYRCLTGEAQYASLMFKAFLLNPRPDFLKAGEGLLHDLCRAQRVSRNPGLHGAFPASIPVYGKYFPFRCVNWTSKFFLDAVRLWRQCMLLPDGV